LMMKGMMPATMKAVIIQRPIDRLPIEQGGRYNSGGLRTRDPFWWTHLHTIG